MRICFVSYNYPSKYCTDFVFVQQLVETIAAMGHHCQVVAPLSKSHDPHIYQNIEEHICGKGKISVYRPKYVTLSNLHIGKFYFSNWLRKLAIQRGMRLLREKPDAIYGHFWSQAFFAYKFAKNHGIPLFVASGESVIRMNFIVKKELDAFRDYVSGVICVSSKNRDESVKLGLATLDKCEVFPNAINSILFKKQNRLECRNKLGIRQDAFVVVFVGWFNERKGALRLAKALDNLGSVNSIFIGKGEQDPQCEGILFKGSLPHEEVPLYLNAADVFVLPTLHEGCCNAVVEAMACGLPIVSSDRPFNWDVLNGSNSILVDPESVDEIANAILTLRDNPKQRADMGASALKRAEDLTLEKRAEAIVRFIQNRIKQS